MSEMISPVSNTTAGIYLLNTMSREARGDIFKQFNIVREDGKDVLVDVKMTINGVEVDFSESVTEMWLRMQSSYEEHILEKAKELLSQTRLEKLEGILRQAECEIQGELEKLFNKKFEE